jgi:uncharacterized protein with HEPN domain
MKKNNEVYLEDMLDSANHIIEYCRDYDYVKFANTKLVQDAVIRNLEIIGEAAKKLSPEFRDENPDLPVREAIGMRNLLVHEYDYINVDEVWKVVKEDLPSLIEQLERIIATLR